MATQVHHNAMGYKTVVTIDRYNNERVYKFKPAREGVGVEPQDGYTPVVLRALWDEGIPVDWSPDDLSATERAEIDGFCDDCGDALIQEQVAPNEFKTYCAKCDD